ncbi:NB-ARC [Arabidopsis thaliana x Arabidopsis arenosa]|uniref:NB-ARC n=1 Tax=Arabidopsis thaliana x Arabidopsis arenosa TaxID=1240361 RepID=A0A8T2D0M0_9BRAS|nr:NB-ARC [Arabidopsis thaliana x Arabidopsis arenosa]
MVDSKKSSHQVNIICEMKAMKVLNSFVGHLSAALRSEDISVDVFTNGISRDQFQEAKVSVVVYSGNYQYSTPKNITQLIRIMGQEEGLLILSSLLLRRDDSSNSIRSDAELVEDIVRYVYGKLYPTERIGIYPRLMEIDNLLCEQSWDVRTLGIWGMPGIGKTTLAEAVFDHMSNDYDACCFIENFDEALHKAGPHRLLEENIGKFLERKFGINDSPYIPRRSLLKDKLCDTRILVVLDDVRNPLIAESFLRRLDWFGPGSLIIITSRYKQVFSLCQINQIYEVQGLSKHDALQLFSRSAFAKDVPEQNDKELSMKVIEYANGNPLALSIYGRELYGNKSEIETAFLELKKCPPKKIQDRLKSVYSELGDNEKYIFFDIACFFKGENVDYAVQLLKGCGYYPRVGIDAAEDIEGISLDILNLTFDVNPDSFKRMVNLRFLKVYHSHSNIVHGLNFPKGLNSLPCALRLLHWENYPFESLPQGFDLREVVELSMPDSQLKKLKARTKNLEKLKRISLCHSRQLVEFSIHEYAQNIELIDLQGCTRLESFVSMTELQHLRVLNLSGCRNIKSVPGIPPNIEELYLQETSIEEIPISIVARSSQQNCEELMHHIKQFPGLEHIDLESHVTNLIKFGSYNQGTGKLVRLNMKNCFQLRSLPDMINLESLQVLDLSHCTRLEEIKGFPGNIKELYLAGAGIRELPEFPESLEFLNAHDCHLLKLVRLDFNKIPRHYTFSNCFNLSLEKTAEFLEKGMTRMIRLVREQNQEHIKAPGFNICIPADTCQKSSFHWRTGSFVMVELAPCKRKALSGFAMSVLVSFRDDHHNAVGLGIRCVCTWKTKTGHSNRIERIFQCWAPKEAPRVERDHIFVFYDANMHPCVGKGMDHMMSIDELKFEFHTVSGENKGLGEKCVVTDCDVRVVMDSQGDSSLGEDSNTIQDIPPEFSKELKAKKVSPQHSKPHELSIVGNVAKRIRNMGNKVRKWVTKSDNKEYLEE